MRANGGVREVLGTGMLGKGDPRNGGSLVWGGGVRGGIWGQFGAVRCDLAVSGVGFGAVLGDLT